MVKTNTAQGSAESNYSEASLARRAATEKTGLGWQMLGQRRSGHQAFKQLLMTVDRMLAWSRLRGPLIRWLAAPQVRRLAAWDSTLPEAFDGYRILHLTDLHLEMAPELVTRALAALPERDYDLLAITGDFRDAACYSTLEEPLRQLLEGLRLIDGVLATLGNHDSLAALPLLDRLGIQLLMNASATIGRSGAAMTITAVEDSHFHYSEDSVKALTHSAAGNPTAAESTAGYRVVLAHTPDFFRWSAVAGYNLYLCGHTHGGQICLPGGHPLLLHTVAPMSKIRDPWQQGAMLGFTGRGLGFSRLAIRTFCPPEVAVITLRRLTSGEGSYWREDGARIENR